MDIDDDLQQRLLSKLSEYGDSLLDEDDYKKSKAQIKKRKQDKIKTKLQNAEDNPNIKTPTSAPTSTNTKKKKKNKAVKNSDLAVQGNKTTERQVNFDEELRQFREEELEKERQEKEAGLRKEGGRMKRPAPEVIVFEDPSRRKKKKMTSKEGGEEHSDEFNLRRARREVRQFGLSGFSFEDREKCEAERAIGLGAWAPKRDYINYKEYMEQQRKQKEQDRMQREMDRKMGYSVSKKPSSEKTRIKNQGFWRDATKEKNFFLDGQVGRFKHGVQVVSKDDITKTKAQSKRRKHATKTKRIKL